jgi:hypothetical protein
MKTTSNIESLESRIAPAATFTFADVDGDFITIKTSKGTDAQLAAIINPFLVAEGLGMELQKIDFSANAPIFEGTSLTVTAKRTSVGGDGRVNVGYLDATGTIILALALDDQPRLFARLRVTIAPYSIPPTVFRNEARPSAPGCAPSFAGNRVRGRCGFHRRDARH